MMQRTLVALSALFVVAGCGQGYPPVAESADALSDIACDQTGCISRSALQAQIKSRLDGKVVGYALRVGGQSAVVAGTARTKTDSPPSGIAMTSSRPIEAASITKLVTTIAALHALDANGISLDTSIGGYLWPQWPQTSNFGLITFRQLLTQKSGIRADCGGATTSYATLKSVVTAGVNTADQGVAYYDNCNFAIFRELLPFMDGQKYTGNANDTDRAAWSAAYYASYVNQHVFAPLVNGSRSCDGASSSDILSYPDPPGSAAGIDSFGFSTLTCGGGGYFLSLDDLFALASELANAAGTQVLTADEKKTMATAQLGWDNDNFAGGSGACGTTLCKNGEMDQSGASVETFVGVARCNVPIALLVNSPLPSPYDAGGAITNVVLDSIDAARSTSGTPLCCDGSTPCGGDPVTHLNGSCCGDGQVCDAAKGQCVKQCGGARAGCLSSADCCSPNKCINFRCGCYARGTACSSSSVCCGTDECKNGVCVAPTVGFCNGRPTPTSPPCLHWSCCGAQGWRCGGCA